ncbi:MAG: hypothetical protein IJT41_07265 [Clostridia bacterium]|nr:hypothetical protein [Clostridia bacterium]
MARVQKVQSRDTDENREAIESVLAANGFTNDREDERVFMRSDLTRRMLVTVKSARISFHVGYFRKIKHASVDHASRILLRLNDVHHLSFGLDPLDNEVVQDYTVILREAPITREAFEAVFKRFLHNAERGTDLLRTHLRAFLVGLLDEEDSSESAFQRMLLPRFAAGDDLFDVDDLDDDDDDDDDGFLVVDKDDDVDDVDCDGVDEDVDDDVDDDDDGDGGDWYGGNGNHAGKRNPAFRRIPRDQTYWLNIVDGDET